ncbi:FAD-dependent oxidoreductase [Reichenbachiella sp. MSK19-1]|uniref:FAD-dependent oxidoreductase n=1 Tax=Reichenbachiella sp. MSK19-1 TaxID=1897631 RepID=UPI000E6C8C5D|nr:FAD-dependent oxidoreductase [Reichenbachiella sp. MSK19-1]RJE71968.1 hypothetical protein BGP76_07765 [Reichenbachiella sp. MSK19-1]
MKKIETDILVVGGGVAGFAAAMAASRAGTDILLVDRHEAVGGNAVHSNVGTICGAYHHHKEGQDFLPVDHPFLKEVVAALKLEPMDYHQGLVVAPYRVEQLSAYLQKTLASQQVKVWTEAEVIATETNETELTHVMIDRQGEQFEIHATQYVDCSGRGVLSDLSGLEMLKSERYQMASQVFSVSGLTSSEAYSLEFSIKKSVVQDKNAAYEAVLKTISLVPGSLQDGTASVKFTLPHEITDEVSQYVLNQKGREWSVRLFDWLVKYVPSFAAAKLEKIYPQVGIRIQQRSRGQYVLTEEDVLSGRKFDSANIKGTWPIEEWNQDSRVDLTHISGHGYFEIPVECLRSYRLDNLFLGGKNISATDRAIASARVIGTCLQTGFEAGTLAYQQL